MWMRADGVWPTPDRDLLVSYTLFRTTCIHTRALFWARMAETPVCHQICHEGWGRLLIIYRVSGDKARNAPNLEVQEAT